MATVQSIVGHGSPAMTRHYTHVGIDNLKNAVNRLSVISDMKKSNIRTKINNLLNGIPDDKLHKIYELIKADL